MLDQITEIDRKYVPLLRDLYKTNNLKNDITYVTIDTYIQWFQQDPQITYLKFFCLNGDFSHGTFVVTVNIFLTLFLSMMCWILKL